MRKWSRAIMLVLWACVVAAGVYVAVFDRTLLHAGLQSVASTSLVAAAVVYLIAGCLRGFTLLPVTLLLVAGLPFFPPGLLFVLTVAGILVSSTSIYWFSEALGLEERLARKHAARVNQLKAALTRYELPVIIAWSFFPLLSTDVIGYVCGGLRINFAKYLLGIALGEGVICALYIFLGSNAMRLFVFKI